MIILIGQVTSHKIQPVNHNKITSMATKLGGSRPRPISANTTHCATDCQEVTSCKGTKWKNGKRILVTRTQFLNPLFSCLHSQIHTFVFFLPLTGKCTQWTYMKNNALFLIFQLRNYFLHFDQVDCYWWFILEFITCGEQTSRCQWDSFR
jgi:hypothetical protein